MRNAQKILTAVLTALLAWSAQAQIPVFKADYTSQDGTDLKLMNPRMEPAGTNAPYLHGFWAFEIDRSTNYGRSWNGMYTNTTDVLPFNGIFQDVPPAKLPGKMALTDPMLGMMVNYRAQVAPCLNWKTVVAYHFRNGWNGFVPPYTNKYLTRTIMEEWLNVFSGVTNEVYGSPWTLVETLDPITGNETAVAGLPPDPQYSGWPFGGEFTFPFGDPTVATNPNYTVTDAHYRFVQDSGPGDPRYIHYTDVWLSNPNTMGMVEAATQGLLDRTLSNAAWSTLTMAWYGDCGPETCGDTSQDLDAMGNFYPTIPGSPSWPNPAYPTYTNYPYTPGMSSWVESPWPVNNYTAAAGSLYVPCNWSGWITLQNYALYVGYDQPEMYLKWGSRVRGPWGWTVNTSYFATSYTAPTGQGTQFVSTDCGVSLNLQAPPPDVNTNWCIMATPATGP